MPIDHSLTYKTFKFRNIPHLHRLFLLKRIIRRIRLGEIQGYLDVGCSNGFLTNEIQKIVQAKKVVGADYRNENLKIAQGRYQQFSFQKINLNTEVTFQEKFDFITCLETLEHTGNLTNALEQICNQLSVGGRLLITVPIEIGFMGILKFMLKNFVYNDKFSEISPDPKVKRRYFWSLLKRSRISAFRDPAKQGYGAHYGFDYRDIDDFLFKNRITYRKYRSLSTMYYVIIKDS